MRERILVVNGTTYVKAVSVSEGRIRRVTVPNKPKAHNRPTLREFINSNPEYAAKFS
jgi:hypothetical protein